MKAEFAAYARRVAGSALYWGKNSRVEKEGEISRFLPIFPHFSPSWQRTHSSQPEDERLTCTCGSRYSRGKGVKRNWGGKPDIEDLMGEIAGRAARPWGALPMWRGAPERAITQTPAKRE
jgi:hypothetical protein